MKKLLRVLFVIFVIVCVTWIVLQLTEVTVEVYVRETTLQGSEFLKHTANQLKQNSERYEQLVEENEKANDALFADAVSALENVDLDDLSEENIALGNDKLRNVRAISGADFFAVTDAEDVIRFASAKHYLEKSISYAIPAGDTRETCRAERLAGTGHTLYGCFERATKKSTAGMITSLNDVLSAYPTSSDNFVFAVDNEANTFAFLKLGGTDLSGTPTANLRYQQTSYENGLSDISIEGKDYTGVSVHSETGSYGDLTIFLVNSTNFSFSAPGYLAVMYIVLILFIVLLVGFCRSAAANAGGRLAYLGSVVLAVLLFIGGYAVAAYFELSLMDLTDSMKEMSESQQVAFELYHDSQTKIANTRQSLLNDRSTASANLLAYRIRENAAGLNAASADSGSLYCYYTAAEDGGSLQVLNEFGAPETSLAESESLRMMADNQDFTNVYVLNRNGRTVATNGNNWYYSISRLNEADQPYIDVLDRKTASYAEYIQTDDGYAVRTVVPLDVYAYVRDDGSILYLNAADYDKAAALVAENSGQKSTVSDILVMDEAEDGAVNASASNGETDIEVDGTPTVLGMLLVAEKPTSIDYLLDEYDFKNIANTVKTIYGVDTVFMAEDQFEEAPSMFEFTTMNGTHVLAYATEAATEDGSAGYAVSYEDVKACYSMRNGILPQHVALVGGCMLLLALLIMFEVERKSGERFDTKYLSLSLTAGLSDSVVIIASLVILSCLFLSYLSNNPVNTDAVRYILKGNWTRGGNMFAVAHSIMTFIVCLAVRNVMTWMIRTISKAFDEDTANRIRVIGSLFSLGLFLFAILRTAFNLGFNVQELAASAGILTAIIAFGSKTLIQDNLSGLLTVVSRKYRLGDVITVNGFTGIVQSIGLQQTRLVNKDGEVLTYNNSDISKFVQRSSGRTRAWVEVEVDGSEKLAKVDAVINASLPKLNKSVKGISIGPVGYYGPIEQTENGYKIMLYADCSEHDRLLCILRLKDSAEEVLKEAGIEVRS